jgi:hypothetical protein
MRVGFVPHFSFLSSMQDLVRRGIGPVIDRAGKCAYDSFHASSCRRYKIQSVVESA